MKFDLHVHTRWSGDGVNTPAMIISRAKKRGLAGVAITDHNTMEGVARVRALAPPGFIVIPGVEYSTDHGHILALFCETFAKDFPRDNKGRFSLAELSPFVREQGGILIAAHPYQTPAYLDEQGPCGLPASLFTYVDGLESANARALSRDSGSKARVEAAAKESGLFVTGGSDAHLPMELGRCYTEFPPTVEKTLPALREALLQGLQRADGQPGNMIYRKASKLWEKVRPIG